MRIDDVRRIDLGTFVRPAEETGTGQPAIEAVHGYVVRTRAGVLLLDTGLGAADEETEAWYRPRRVPLPEALATAGLTPADISLVVNCHLHFDHIGGNPQLSGRPVFCQRSELETARAGGYTVPELVDFAGARYELLDGETEILATTTANGLRTTFQRACGTLGLNSLRQSERTSNLAPSMAWSSEYTGVGPQQILRMRCRRWAEAVARIRGQ